MINKKKILLVGDQPGWAFHNIILFVRKHLKHKFDLYHDFVLYHPAFEDPNKETSSKTDQNFVFKKKLLFQKVSVLRSLEYRFIKKLNQCNLLAFNEHGRFQRLTKDNKYDLVVYLDHYFPFDGDFSHIHSKKIIQGTFNDVFPPRKLFRIPNSGEIKPINDGHEFCDIFLKSADALLIGSPSIRAQYEKFFEKPILFANMAYDESVFKQKAQNNSEKFILGWTGNPDREFKGFYSIVVEVLEELKRSGYNVELRTQFSGTLNSLAYFWQGIDLAIIASEADAGPSMFMEASLCGVPSISTRIGMPAYVIVDRENGLFCDRNVTDFVEKITFLIQNPERLEKMKTKIRKDYIEKLGVHVQIKNWENLFETILKDD
jgi:glycosyltransferase involved in cell wall biosynthesis